MTRSDFSVIKQLLEQSVSGSISTKELEGFVHLSRGMVEAYLRTTRSSVTHLALHQGLTVTDLAYDCLGELFARDTAGSFFRLTGLANSLDRPLDDSTPDQVFFAFKSFLFRMVDAHLARVYALADPRHSRIQRNIKEGLKDSTLFELRRDFRGYVLYPCDIDSLDEKRPALPDELEQLFLKTARRGASFPDLLQVLYATLAGQEDFRRSITLIVVVHVFKLMYPDVAEDDAETGAEVFSVDALSEQDIAILRDRVEFSVKEKILVTYLVRGKLTREMAKAMADAFHDILMEWSAGEPLSRTLPGYLQHYIPISDLEYEQDYRSKMEYLFKHAKREFSNLLIDPL